MSQKIGLADNPSNLSLLQDNKYKFVIPNLPFAIYFCQSVNLPGVTTSSAEMATPFHIQKRHGDRLMYEPLVITAQVDEDLRVWEETYNWLMSITTPLGFDQYKTNIRTGEIYNDGILEFHRNSNLTNLRIKFNECCITGMGPLQMSTQKDRPDILVVDITLDYDTFEVERL